MLSFHPVPTCYHTAVVIILTDLVCTSRRYIDDLCDPHPCGNGDCRMLAPGDAYACTCDEGWTGSACEIGVCLKYIG